MRFLKKFDIVDNNIVDENIVIIIDNDIVDKIERSY